VADVVISMSTSYCSLLAFLGIALILLGAFQRSWALLAVWVGLDCLALAFAHSKGVHRLFGKRPDGTLSWWGWIVFLPMLTYMHAIWHLARILRRRPAHSVIDENLVVGRRLLVSELEAEFDNYVDLAAEFGEPSLIRHSPSYRSFPILNDAAPSPEALLAAIRSLKPGRTFVHCGRGYSRSALFALAVLLESGAVHGVEEGWRKLQAARRGVRLNRAQQACIEGVAKLGSGGDPGPTGGRQ
jgi:protein-tyrosine phosphatase